MSEFSKNLVNTAELGRSIKRKREDAGLSLRDVADETGVSASTLELRSVARSGWEGSLLLS